MVLLSAAYLLLRGAKLLLRAASFHSDLRLHTIDTEQHVVSAQRAMGAIIDDNLKENVRDIKIN